MTYADHSDYATYVAPVAPEDEDRVDALLETASELIADYCGWHVAPSVTETITLDGEGGRLFQVPSLYVTDVAHVWWADRRLTEPLEIDPNQYTWNECGEIEMDGSFLPWWLEWSVELPPIPTPSGLLPTTKASIKVELTHGYAEIPRTLKLAACIMVRNSAALDAPTPAGVSSMTTGQVTVSYDYRQPRMLAVEPLGDLLGRYVLEC